MIIDTCSWVLFLFVLLNHIFRLHRTSFLFLEFVLSYWPLTGFRFQLTNSIFFSNRPCLRQVDRFRLLVDRIALKTIIIVTFHFSLFTLNLHFLLKTVKNYSRGRLKLFPCLQGYVKTPLNLVFHHPLGVFFSLLYLFFHFINFQGIGFILLISPKFFHKCLLMKDLGRVVSLLKTFPDLTP